MVERVMIAAGGTGGHVYPALAVAAALTDLRPDVEVEFVGTAGKFEAQAVPAAGWPLFTVEALPLARKVSAQTLRLPTVLLRGMRTLRRRIRAREVAVACVFGGYVSVPLVLAARREHLPLVVHEQNSVPGLANRLAARWARHVAVTFAASADRFPHPERVTLTGNPVRPGFDADARQWARSAAVEKFGLDPQRRTLLAFGGSQGARRINQALVAATPHWREPGRIQILHIAGRNQIAAVEQAWEETMHGDDRLIVHRTDFVEQMEQAYAAADVALCRAGASTIAELTLVGLPSVLVPYPHATDDHQTRNAADLAAAGGAVVVPDADLDGAVLAAACEPLLLDETRHEAATAAALGFARPDAAHAVARLILAAAEEGR